MPQNSQLVGVNLLRALACSTVFVCHFSQKLHSSLVLDPWLNWLPFFERVGSFGVGIFFVLSGYLLARPFWQMYDAQHSLPSARIYFMRRAARILPGYYLALALSVLVSVFIFNGAFDLQEFIRLLAGIFFVSEWHWLTLFPVEVNGPLWSIGFEVMCYIFMPLGFFGIVALNGVGQVWRARILWLCVIGFSLVLHWIFVLLVHPPADGRGWSHGLIGGAKEWVPIYNPFAFFAMFALGSLAASLSVRLGNMRHWMFDVLAILSLLGAIALMIAVYNGQLKEELFLGVPYAFPLFHLFVAAFLIAAPASSMLERMIEVGLVKYIARVSFGIYIYHYLVIEISGQFLMTNLGPDVLREPLVVVLLFAFMTSATLFLAHLSYLVLEDPVMKWARRKEWRKPARERPGSQPLLRA